MRLASMEIVLGQMINVYKNFENLKGRDHLQDLGIYGRISD
jgi:hypothetical protein